MRVSTAETSREPKQPSRLEKRKNTGPGCPPPLDRNRV
jgi:hypothetical protein